MKKISSIVSVIFITLLMASSSSALNYGPDYFFINDPLYDAEVTLMFDNHSNGNRNLNGIFTFGVYDRENPDNMAVLFDHDWKDYLFTTFKISGGTITGNWYDIGITATSLLPTNMSDAFGFFFEISNGARPPAKTPNGAEKTYYTDATLNIPFGIEFVQTQVYGDGPEQGAFVSLLSNNLGKSENHKILATLRVSDVSPLKQAAPVPEPATMLLLGVGLIGVAGLARKKIHP